MMKKENFESSFNSCVCRNQCFWREFSKSPMGNFLYLKELVEIGKQLLPSATEVHGDSSTPRSCVKVLLNLLQQQRFLHWWVAVNCSISTCRVMLAVMRTSKLAKKCNKSWKKGRKEGVKLCCVFTFSYR